MSNKIVMIETFVPESSAERVRLAMGNAGAGVVGKYSHCSFSAKGIGRFRPEAGSDPAVGSVGKLEEVREERITMVCAEKLIDKVAKAIRKNHPYEEVPIFIYPVLSA